MKMSEEEILIYLDGCIRYWRKKKEEVTGDEVICACYVDAFQSVRSSLFGEILPLEKC